MDAGTMDPQSVVIGVREDGEVLVARAREGDFSAFETLYRDHVGRVHALCLRLSGDPALAEELTQETFIRAWRKLATFRGEGGFRSWLARLAVNVTLAERRALGRRRRREERATSVGSPLGGATSGPRERLDLERAIAGLPTRARDVFVLHDVHGYRHREVADLLGISAGASKAQLNRARRLLRETLNS